MTEMMKKLCKIVGANPEMMQYERMTVDEILDCIHCAPDDDGDIIDLDTGENTYIGYEELL